MKTSGTIEKIEHRNKKTSKGDIKFTYVTVEGVEYNAGFSNRFPKEVSEGDTVEFEWESKFGERQVTSGLGPGASKPKSGSSGKPFPVPLDHGDRSIIRQNALTNARGVLEAYGVGKWSDLDDIAEEIIRIAYKFEEYSSGQREVNEAKRRKGESDE